MNDNTNDSIEVLTGAAAQPMRIEPRSVPRPDYRPVYQVLCLLPQQGRWTTAQRERWLTAIAAMADFAIEVVDDSR